MEDKTEIITMEERLVDDPRGLNRVTIIGDLIFRKIKPEVEEVPVEEVE